MALASQAWRPEFDPQGYIKVEEETPQTSTCHLGQARPHKHLQ